MNARRHFLIVATIWAFLSAIGIALVACAPLALGRYEVARRAVAEARAVDDLVEILGRNAAVHAYARQAKDRQMEIDAAEINTFPIGDDADVL